MNEIKIKALEVIQPIGSFYCGVIDADILKKITYSDIRRLESNGGRELDDYIGIQRPLSETRRKQIEKYILNIDATFPNSIIVSIGGEYVDWDSRTNTLTIDMPQDDSLSDIAKILDGQHRVSGFTESNCHFINDDGERQPFQVLVSFFIDCDISTQANIFATVNLAQTKVNRSLVYDLESLAIARSPEKTCHDIAVLLNADADGPFYRRIKRLGVATPDIKNELLTQASFVSNILKLITKDAVSDRNYYLAIEKKEVKKNKYQLENTSYNDLASYPFRAAFLAGSDDIIARNIDNFFSSISSLWPKAWDRKNKVSVLNKTVGFIALCRILKHLMGKIIEAEGVSESRVITFDEFYEMLDGGLLDDAAFESLEPTSKTSGRVYKMIRENLAL